MRIKAWQVGAAEAHGNKRLGTDGARLWLHAPRRQQAAGLGYQSEEAELTCQSCICYNL